MEDKRSRFKKVAETRTNKIINMIELLGNCANTSNYEYTEKEVKKIFEAIEHSLKNTKNKFTIAQSKKRKFEL